jgi:hypothetical protein
MHRAKHFAGVVQMLFRIEQEHAVALGAESLFRLKAGTQKKSAFKLTPAQMA